MNVSRRKWLATAGSVGTGVVLLGCQLKSQKELDEEASEKAGKESAGSEVNATEDLMREHGVLRRCLLVYQESAAKLRSNAAVPPAEIEKTAKLFQVFGEDYHEKKLEETHIFPAVQNAGGLAAAYIGVLNAQHQRGREITQYILSVTGATKLGAGVQEFARLLESFVRMYEHHAVIEDTIVFPAWKSTMSKDQLDVISDKFEAIEHQQFGKDGFEAAVKRIADIETNLGLADLGQFTAGEPPAPRNGTK